MITGDLNGRTGLLDDIFHEDGGEEPFIPNTNNNSYHFPNRRNCDISIDSHGRKIIQLCHMFDLKILNGRQSGDFIGNFTHLNYNGGVSTIDYGLCNNILYDSVENFFVLPQNELSDHSKIVTYFKNNIVVKENPLDTYPWKKIEFQI